MKKIRLFTFYSIKYLNITMMFTMFIILLLQVITRKFLDTPLSWPEELSLVTMIWITFFGAYQCTVEESHLKMDFLQSKVPERLKPFILVTSKSVVLVFLGATCFWGFSFIQNVGSLTMPVTGLPMWVPYLIIWISCMLMFIEFTFQILGHISSGYSHREEDEEKCSQS
ncbi:TRAP transporter small permease [Thalassobacillus sp. CUG 92003]|uniref:TRAP transporter small permease n=1 Tax=Thalassobacillus sp. CUG 92003 TaxID=2736641 RepID=UPI0015E6A959|nr:TRAP transporter small permease [Thalassobacillus sp. CUG 92003]